MIIRPKSDEQIVVERSVLESSKDSALKLLAITVGSMIDDLKTLRAQLGCLQQYKAAVDPLQIEQAAKLGQSLYQDAIKTLWAEFPFTCIDLIERADKSKTLVNPETVAVDLLSFIDAAKPFMFDEDDDSCE